MNELNIEVDFEYFPIGEGQDAFSRFGDFWSIWHRHFRKGKIPSWQEFSASEFTGWFHNLQLYEFLTSEPDPVFRIMPSAFVSAYGAEGTGKRFSEAMPTAYNTVGRNYFARMREGKDIVLINGKFPLKGRQHVPFAVAGFPLSKDGIVISHVLECFMEVSEYLPAGTSPKRATLRLKL